MRIQNNTMTIFFLASQTRPLPRNQNYNTIEQMLTTFNHKHYTIYTEVLNNNMSDKDKHSTQRRIASTIL